MTIEELYELFGLTFINSKIGLELEKVELNHRYREAVEILRKSLDELLILVNKNKRLGGDTYEFRNALMRTNHIVNSEFVLFTNKYTNVDADSFAEFHKKYEDAWQYMDENIHKLDIKIMEAQDAEEEKIKKAEEAKRIEREREEKAKSTEEVKNEKVFAAMKPEEKKLKESKDAVISINEKNKKKADNNTDFDRLAMIYDDLIVDEKKNPLLFEIKELVLKSEETKANNALIVKLCFDYLMQNKNLFCKNEQRSIMDLVHATVAVIDYKLASNIADELTKDKDVGGCIKKHNDYLAAKNRTDGRITPITADNSLAGAGIDKKISKDSSFRMPVTSEDNTTVSNLKMIYIKLNSWQCTHLFYKNSEKFEKMLKSIDQTLKYVDVNAKRGGADPAVLKEMYNNIKKCTNDYIDKKLVPTSSVGIARQELALATLLAIDKDEGYRMIERVETARKENNDDLKADESNKNIPDLQKAHAKIVNNTKLNEKWSRGEMLEYLDKLMKFNGYRSDDPQFLKLITVSQYIARKTMYNHLTKLPAEAVDEFRENVFERIHDMESAVGQMDEVKEAYYAVEDNRRYIMEPYVHREEFDINKVYDKFNELIVKRAQEKKQNHPLKEIIKNHKELSAEAANQPQNELNI